MGRSVRIAYKKPEAKSSNSVHRVRKAERSKSRNSPVEHVLFLQRTLGNQAVQRLMKSGAVQAKLRIGMPGDIYEQEADRVAEQVMRMPTERVLKGSVNSGIAIQRKCPMCKDKKKNDEMKLLQIKEAPGHTPEVTPDLEKRLNDLREGGQPLPESVRAFYEPRFGRDFSYVRVHTDAKAAEVVRAVDAKAFTVGRDMVFGEGEYAPDSNSGRQLLAHELVHVIQQNPIGLPTNLDTDAAGERSTSEMIYAVDIGKRQATIPGTTAVRVARQPTTSEDIDARIKASEQSIKAEYTRKCADKRILQRLERIKLDPIEEHARLTTRINNIPHLFEEKRLLDQKLKRGEIPSMNVDGGKTYWREMSQLLIKYDFPPNYFLTTEDNELAIARCQLLRFQWDMVRTDFHFGKQLLQPETR